ncbi:MAG: tRNA 2-thiouridine(34) synthase MnmA [Gammaproteobacteria bacterium]|nr:tRNA 2-thiouridine(34) synthase MnmA [Gammaproteobacteria bacterium]
MLNISPKPQHVIAGLSGGVDSSVAALLLKNSGVNLQGIFMKNWEEDDDDKYCSATEDLQDADKVATALGIPLITRNFSGEYWENVFQLFLDEYRQGRTPNPDILCNKEIKFKTFLEHATILGADHIATGHYARIQQRNGLFHLLKSIDSNKDQTYFLHQLNQFQLSKSIFPLGEYTKPEVRCIAERSNFANFDKKDSTGICFIGERKFKAFLSQYLPAQPGEIRSVDNNIIGEHDGLMYYTLGQRQGLKIGGSKFGNGLPWYVVSKDLDNNTLIVAQGHEHPRLFSRFLKSGPVHWIAEAPSALPFQCRAKTRYRQADQACTIIDMDSEACTVRFGKPQRAITPGQSVVFYLGNECLGGGIISQAYN